MTYRGRFAPSPTGDVHFGTARTALAAWLAARAAGGAYVMRVEDLDGPRSVPGAEERILEDLRWLGLDWEEGPDVGGPHAPYRQSLRLARYDAAVEQLLAGGHAFRCWCSRAEVARAAAAPHGPADDGPRYPGTCRARTTPPPRDRRPSVRLRVDAEDVTFVDGVHGPWRENVAAAIGDFVIRRADGIPAYQLAVVVDDAAMGMTDIVRGDDLLGSTGRQLLLYRALGLEPPRFAHVPLILGADKKRLSKRHGATSVTEYQRQGYLSEAMTNFLALLGWSPGGDQEIFTHDELVERFTLEGISGGNAVFNPEKLDWFNQQHLARLSSDDLIARVKPELEAAGLWSDALTGDRRAWFARVLALLVPRAKRLGDFAPQAAPFLGDVTSYDQAAVDKHLSAPGVAHHVSALADAYRDLNPFDEISTERVLRSVAEQGGVKFGALVHATRIAVTGRAVSPGLFETLVLIGRPRVVARLEALARYLAERSGAVAEGA